MIESHLHAGRQDVPSEGPQGLKYGVSITDACIDWNATIPMLDALNEVRACVQARLETERDTQAVKARRELRIQSRLGTS